MNYTRRSPDVKGIRPKIENILKINPRPPEGARGNGIALAGIVSERPREVGGGVSVPEVGVDDREKFGPEVAIVVEIAREPNENRPNVFDFVRIPVFPKFRFGRFVRTERVANDESRSVQNSVSRCE